MQTTVALLEHAQRVHEVWAGSSWAKAKPPAAGAGGDPRSGFQVVFWIATAGVALFVLFNRKLAVIGGAIAAVLVGATLAYGPQSMYQSVGTGGGHLLTAIASHF